MTACVRTALVTGANRGLGLETCRQLAKSGFRAILTSRSDDGARAVRRLVKEGLSVEHRQLDVADATSFTELADALREDGMSLDVLVNNTGIALDGFNADVARRASDVDFRASRRRLANGSSRRTSRATRSSHASYQSKWNASCNARGGTTLVYWPNNEDVMSVVGWVCCERLKRLKASSRTRAR